MGVPEAIGVNPSACRSPIVSERVLFKGQSVRVVVRLDMAGERKASWWWIFFQKSKNELTAIAWHHCSNSTQIESAQQASNDD